VKVLSGPGRRTVRASSGGPPCAASWALISVARVLGLATSLDSPTVKETIHPCWLTRVGLMIPSLMASIAVVRVRTIVQSASGWPATQPGATSGVVVWPSCTI
jgi:hypothetical protein